MPGAQTEISPLIGASTPASDDETAIAVTPTVPRSSLEKTIWERSPLTIGAYSLFCLVGALPTSALVLWHAKGILPGQVKNWDDFVEQWDNSDASTIVAMLRFTNSLLMNWLFNLKYFDQAFKTVVQKAIDFPRETPKQRAAYIAALIFALAGGITFGAIGYAEFEFVPEIAIVFFLLNFTSYFAPRLQAIYATLIKIGDESHALLNEMKWYLSVANINDLHQPNLQANMDSNRWADELLETFRSLIKTTVQAPDVLSKRRYQRALMRMGDMILSGMILYPILAPYAQRGLKGLNILFNLSEDEAIYTSPALIPGYLMSFSSYIFYFRCFANARASVYDFSHYIYELLQKGYKKRALTWGGSALLFGIMCASSSGGIENIYQDTLAKDYVDYFPLLTEWQPLWNAMTYTAGVLINYVSIIHLLLELACVRDIQMPELYGRNFLMRHLKHGSFFAPDSERLIQCKWDFIAAVEDRNDGDDSSYDEVDIEDGFSHYSFFQSKETFHAQERQANNVWRWYDWLNPVRHVRACIATEEDPGTRMRSAF